MDAEDSVRDLIERTALKSWSSSTFTEMAYVEERFGDSIAWSGLVGVFLEGFAWLEESETGNHVVVVNREGPINTPEAAVRAYIVAKYRSEQK